MRLALSKRALMDIDPNIPALRRLQREDRRLVALEHKLATVPLRLKELDTDLRKLEEMLSSEREKLEESRRFQTSQRQMLEDDEDQIRSSRARIAQVKNPRELNAAQREIETTRRMVQSRTDELVKVATAIEEAQTRIDTVESSLTEFREQARAERERLEVESVEAQAMLTKLSENRTKLAQAVEPDLLRRYSRIRERSGGIGFVAARNRRCSACKMQVPHQHYVVLRRGTEILACENCGRLLYWVGHFEAETAAKETGDDRTKETRPKEARPKAAAPAKRSSATG